MSVILNPVEQYFDLDGAPLQSGYLYFGEVYGNPVTQPVMVYFDPEFTIPAAQPVRTINGFPVRSGTATGIYAPDDVSILVQNQNKEQIIYIQSSAINTGNTTTIYRESDTSFNADDNNKTFIILNPIVQTFDPSANLGDRWRVNVINMSSGNVTLDPNLSETIDGKSSLTLQPNQIATVYCDGVNLKSTTSIYPSATIASAATLDLRAVKPKLITVSGTNTISAIQMIDGDNFTAIFSGVCQLVHGTNLQLPGSINYTTSVGDIITFISNGTVTRAEISKVDGSPIYVKNATNDPTFSSASSNEAASPQWTKAMSLGWDQTWQDVSASRAIGTTYTNSTNKPIFVSISFFSNANSQLLTYVDGVVLSRDGSAASTDFPYTSSKFIVPAGSTYSVNTFAGTNTINYWAELRG